MSVLQFRYIIKKENYARENKVGGICMKKTRSKIIIIVCILIAAVIGVFFFRNASQIRAAEKDLEESQTRFGKCYLYDHEDEYNRLVGQCQSAINQKDLNAAKKAQTELDDLEEKVVAENKENADAYLKELKSSDTSKAYDSELKKIDDYEDELKSCIQKNDFKSANDIKEEWQKLLAAIQIEYDNLEIQVVQVDTSDYPKVKIYLDIRDKTTDEVPSDLKKGYFCLEEKTGSSNFERMTITEAAQLDQKEALNINMVADVSASMNGTPLVKAKDIMNHFLDSVQFNIGDKVELTTFSTGVQQAVEFTDDKSAISQKISGLTTDNMTSLYDALFAAVNTTAVQDGAKCVVAFTDGKDNYSQCSANDVIEVAKKYKIPVFIIGIGSTINTSELQRIGSETNGFYRNINSIDNMADIYQEIYRQQKEMYMVQYNTAGNNKSTSRQITVEYQDRKIGGKGSSSYDPDTLMSATGSTAGLSEPEKVMHGYLNGFVKAINEHNFSYIEGYLVKGGDVYNETKDYIKKDIKEELLSCNFLDVSYPTSNSCIVHMQETYKIQNNKEPLHMRTIESYYKLLKQSDGSWKIDSYPQSMKVVKKIKY